MQEWNSSYCCLWSEEFDLAVGGFLWASCNTYNMHLSQLLPRTPQIDWCYGPSVLFLIRHAASVRRGFLLFTFDLWFESCRCAVISHHAALTRMLFEILVVGMMCLCDILQPQPWRRNLRCARDAYKGEAFACQVVFGITVSDLFAAKFMSAERVRLYKINKRHCSVSSAYKRVHRSNFQHQHF